MFATVPRPPVPCYSQATRRDAWLVGHAVTAAAVACEAAAAASPALWPAAREAATAADILAVAAAWPCHADAQRICTAQIRDSLDRAAAIIPALSPAAVAVAAARAATV
jgi:hypothetical protein